MPFVTPEGKLQAKIRFALRQQGAAVFNIHGGSPFQEVGIPDLLVCYKGRFVGVEVKLPKGHVKPRQHAVLKRIRAAGGYGIVARSVEDVRDLLLQIDAER